MLKIIRLREQVVQTLTEVLLIVKNGVITTE